MYDCSVIQGAYITHSRPKVHRFPVAAKASRFERAKKWASARTPQDKAYILSGVSAVFVFLGVAVHISKLWDGALIPEASAHALPQPAIPNFIENNNKTIVFKGKEGGIVGQVTHIEPSSEQAGSIKTMSEVDNRANRDLLSVVNKY